MNAQLYISKPGILCAAGANAEELWHNTIFGEQSGITKIKTQYGESFLVGKIQDKYIFPVNCKYDMRIIRIADVALNQIVPYVNAAKQKFGKDRIAVCVGSCDNGSQFSVEAHRVFFEQGSFPKNYSLEVQGADYVATYIKEKFDINGPACVFSTACSSSASAIIKAAELIKADIVDAVVVGGVDIASDTVLLGFNSLESISNEVTNPFSKNRKGITLGEGAAFFVLSKDKTTVHSEGFCDQALLGVGESADASHMTAPQESGESAKVAINAAIKNAQTTQNFFEASQIDYINLHGTGTKLNDSMEANALVLSLPNDYKTIPVSSTKPLTGHTLGAAASLELSICYMAINQNQKSSNAFLPAHINDGEFDDTLPKLNFVQKQKTYSKKINVCMTNSFGFGGCNTSLIIEKYRKRKCQKKKSLFYHNLCHQVS